MAGDVFPAAHDQERIRSVLADLAKTAADFREIAGRAIDHLSTGCLLQLRCPPPFLNSVLNLSPCIASPD